MAGHLLPALRLVHVLCAAGCQPARGQEPRAPLEGRGMVLSCPEGGGCVSGGGCWHGGSSQVCHGRVRGTSAHAGLLFSIAKLLWHCSAPLLRSPWWPREQQATASCAATGSFESGNLGTAPQWSSPVCWCPREGTSSAQHPSKQYPTSSAAVPASSDTGCPTEVALDVGWGQQWHGSGAIPRAGSASDPESGMS